MTTKSRHDDTESQTMDRDGHELMRGPTDRHVPDPSPRGRAARLPDLDRAFVNPAAVFVSPVDVLCQARLLAGCKREILRRWAWDEYLKDVAAAEGMAEGEPSRLDEVKAALLALGEVWRPGPRSPAAAMPVDDRRLEAMAA